MTEVTKKARGRPPARALTAKTNEHLQNCMCGR